MEMLVLYAMPFRMLKDNGELEREGISVFALDRYNLDPCEKMKGSNIAKGRKPIKFISDIELMSQITQVPGVYDIEIEMESNSKMKGEITGVDFEFKGLVKTEFLPAAKPPAKN